MTLEPDDAVNAAEQLLSASATPFPLTQTEMLIDQLKFMKDGCALGVFGWHDKVNRRYQVEAPFYNELLVHPDFVAEFVWGPYGFRDTSRWDAQEIGIALSKQIVNRTWLPEKAIDDLHLFSGSDIDT